MNAQETIYDALGAAPIFPGDIVLVKDEVGLYMAQLRRVYYDFRGRDVVERCDAVAVGDEKRLRRAIVPSQCVKTFIHKGMIWIPAPAFPELAPKPGEEILAYSFKKHVYVECGFMALENGCCYRIALGENEFVVPTNTCALQCYPGIYERKS